MKHLTSTEFVDFLEGALDSSRSRHVSSCERCRRQADQMRDALAQARDVDAPEPSPLFWDHFSARVRDAVAAEPARRPVRTLLWHPAWGLGLGAAIGLLVVAVAIWRPSRGVPTVPSVPPATIDATAGDWVAPLDKVSDDESWTLVTSIADRATWDEIESASFAPSPGAVDSEVFRLSSEERSELARLIRAELPRGES